ncbi:hypothetical protein KS4_16100 [Poriferisphaera corsica]|uniref:Viral coat protein P2 N-terminal domain-containing protein n=1 Tax=Poriferisphaera corsica TaxID=2528020 RepID=A0A517YTN0_9BACT|nr:hypothetical protein [Poriferisphaera corsica]QDU33559.1 hypothetical protein KS4_16100 [Poriferisphaera corsica]
MADAAKTNALAQTRRGQKLKPLKYEENSYNTLKIPRQYPLERLQCRFSCSYTASGGPTVRKFGLSNIVDRVDIKRNGNDTIASIPGHMLRLISQMQTNVKPNEKKPGTSNAAHTAFFAFRLPFNILSYLSLLDPTKDHDLDLTVHFNDPSAVFEGGSITNFVGQMDAETVAIAGGIPGMAGGAGKKYAVRYLVGRNVPIEMTQTDMQIPLSKARIYNRIILKAMDKFGNPSEDIFKGLRVVMGQTTFRLTADFTLRDELIERYNLDPDECEGLYVYDFTTAPERIHEALSNNDATMIFNMEWDVERHNEGDKIVMLEDLLMEKQRVA